MVASLFCLLINAGASLLAGATIFGFPCLLHTSSQLRSAGDEEALKVKLRASDELIKI